MIAPGPARCPIALGTSEAAEAARWGFDARAAMIAEARRRAERLAAPLAAPEPPRPSDPPPEPEPVVSEPEGAPEARAIPEGLRGSARIADILSLCAGAHGFAAADILGPSRRRALVDARQLAMYLARETTTRSWPDIGRRMRRDHTSVLWGYRQVARRLAEDAAFAAEVAALKAKITGDRGIAATGAGHGGDGE